MRNCIRLLVVLVTVLCSPSHAAEKLYYGLLHAHTSFSDGLGTPEEAYARAKSKGSDFFAITPHNHKWAENGAKERKDGVLIAVLSHLEYFTIFSFFNLLIL